MIGETLVGLLPVITGGAIALLGGAVGPVVTHLLSSKKEIRRERVAKFEELFALLSDYAHWMEAERERIVFGKDVTIRPSPLLRAQAICAIYFRDLKPALNEVDRLANPYFLWMAEAGKRRLENSPAINEGFSNAYTPYRRKWLDTIDLVADYAAQKGKNL